MDKTTEREMSPLSFKLEVQIPFSLPTETSAEYLDHCEELLVSQFRQHVRARLEKWINEHTIN